jgi:hypothetical protein
MINKPLNVMYIENNLLSIEALIIRTMGMSPSEFEDFVDDNGIEIEWLDVSKVDVDAGEYIATLPQYEYRNVYSMDGSPIEIEENN